MYRRGQSAGWSQDQGRLWGGSYTWAWLKRTGTISKAEQLGGGEELGGQCYRHLVGGAQTCHSTLGTGSPYHEAPRGPQSRRCQVWGNLAETAHVRRLLRLPNTGKTRPEARWAQPSGVGRAEAAVTLQAGTAVSARALVVEMERKETAKETWGVEQRRYSGAGVRAQQLPPWNRKYSNDQPRLLPECYLSRHQDSRHLR